MLIAIAGGSGFVGKALTKKLLQLGHHVVILTRNLPSEQEQVEKLSYVQWLSPQTDPVKKLQDIDVIINLAGESIGGGRWSATRKERILQSRVQATKEIVRMMTELPKKPKALINASAIGIYGTSETEIFTEDTHKYGDDFLANTVKLWEEHALQAIHLGVRTVLCRFGIILDKNEGALTQIALPYKLMAGGTLGTGRQWVSWIHLVDVVEAIIFAIENEHVAGPLNFTAPNPVPMKTFGQIVGRTLKRPHWLPAPAFALQLVFGEMSILVLQGQNAQPHALQKAGYIFRFEQASDALEDIYK